MKYISVLLAAATIAMVGNSYATEINPNTANMGVTLGAAYDTDREAFIGQGCVAGLLAPTGAAMSTFSFQQSLSEKQAADELGFSAGARVSYGVVTASASAQFMKSSVSTGYSVSAVWLSEYRLPTDTLTKPALSDVGTVVSSNPDQWVGTCGNEYVTEIVRGAKLFFSIRVDFSSKEEKQRFEAKFSLSGPLYSASADLETASREFSQDSTVTVSALQIGGDVSKVTGLFAADEQGRLGFVKCSLGDFEKCAQVVSQALKYATDTRDGFPAQIAPGAQPGASPILYRTAPYSAAGLYKTPPPLVTQAIQRARENLSTEFQHQLRLGLLADRLLNQGFAGDRLLALTSQRSIIDANVSAIVDVALVCYENPLACLDATRSLHVAPVDETAFLLPPLPATSFRIVDTDGRIWSREESLGYFHDCEKSRFGCDLQARETDDTQHSVGLVIYGTALQKASLYFEDVLLQTISLDDPAAGWQKIGDGFRVLIVDSLRGNPGWRDVDVDLQRVNLVDKDKQFARADGTFYVVTEDGFGRKVRTDLLYEQWNQTESVKGDRKITKLDLTVFQDWWHVDVSGPFMPGTRMKFAISLDAPAGADTTDFIRRPMYYTEYCFVSTATERDVCQLQFRLD